MKVYFKVLKKDGYVECRIKKNKNLTFLKIIKFKTDT
jgi:hypothetical protein